MRQCSMTLEIRSQIGKEIPIKCYLESMHSKMALGQAVKHIIIIYFSRGRGKSTKIWSWAVGNYCKTSTICVTSNHPNNWNGDLGSQAKSQHSSTKTAHSQRDLRTAYLAFHLHFQHIPNHPSYLPTATHTFTHCTPHCTASEQLTEPSSCLAWDMVNSVVSSVARGG